MSVSSYNDLAEIYDMWIANYSKALKKMRNFYVNEYLKANGPIVELGVGNGHILIEAAKMGKKVIGIDSSPKMIELCHTKAIRAGVADHVKLIQADFRNFKLPKPVELVAMPYGAITHLLSLTEKRECFQNVIEVLAPGGRLILDQVTYDPKLASKEDGVPYLAFEYADPKTGLETFLWVVSVHSIPDKSSKIILFTEKIGMDGVVTKNMLGSVACSSISHEGMQNLLFETGFQVEACFGDFSSSSPYREGSHQEIFVTRRPK